MMLGQCHFVSTDQADDAHIFQGADCLSAGCRLIIVLSKLIILSLPGSLQQVLVPHL
jgi:hypothetical protein